LRKEEWLELEGKPLTLSLIKLFFLTSLSFSFGDPSVDKIIANRSQWFATLGNTEREREKERETED